MNNKINIRELLRSISEDDLRAFSVFYESYFQKIYDFSKYFVTSNEKCQEIVSDVFFHLWQNRKKLPSIQNIDNYVFISVRNQALKLKKNSSKYVLESFEQVPSDFFIDIDNPEDTFITGEMADIIRKAIDELPERCRVIFLMVREENLKYREVSEILLISERTVHAQMIIAVKKIITAIKQYFPRLNEGKAMLLFLHFFNSKAKDNEA